MVDWRRVQLFRGQQTAAEEEILLKQTPNICGKGLFSHEKKGFSCENCLLPPATDMFMLQELFYFTQMEIGEYRFVSQGLE